jgi:serine/threonine protein kinase
MITPGIIIGSRYRVVRTVGGGGMKVVYLAEDLRLAARACALAEMIDGFTSPEAQRDAIAAFQREADMLAQLSNEHIPRVIDRFSEANHHYLVMEYVDGQTLEDLLKQDGGKLAPDYVIDVALQILETLEYLHGLPQPVIYRDLKPSNVMITANGRVKLIDFGIARFFAPLSSATMIGTQGYAPPEQYRGKVEARSDLYALGATMHHALSGRDPASEPPFSFPPLAKVAPGIDTDLAAIVDQVLAYDVIRRISDAREFYRRLVALRNPSRGGGPAPRVSQAPAKTQLPLPLGTPPRADPAAQSDAAAPPPGSTFAGAPTVVVATPEIRCPSCVRTIPADSRFCSYCATPLHRTDEPASRPTDATMVLSPSRGTEPESAPAEPESSPYPWRRRGRRRWPHRSALLIVLLFLGGFAVMRQIAKSTSDDAPPAGYGGGDAPGGGPSASPAAIPPLVSVRLAALRQTLDLQGYGAVQFQLEGDTLVLSGRISSEMDRGIIRLDCLRYAGGFSLRDNLQVANGDDAG